MGQKGQAKLLLSEIETLLNPLSDQVELYRLTQESLNIIKHNITSVSKYNHHWSLLPLIVCEAISGHYKQALPAAAALQLFIAAGDIFDDIEDADSPESLSAKHGSAIATNVATTLIILAEKGITRLQERSIEDCVIVRIMDAINSSFTTTCAGQHLDLSLNPGAYISEETYLKIAAMKTASTLKCACQIGALLATDRQKVIDTFAILGQNLGMSSQIANDIHGITQGKDILKKKMTLPVIYTLTHVDKLTRHQIETTYGKEPGSVLDNKQIKDLLFSSGAIQYSAIKMELYKQQALDTLSKIEAIIGNVSRLRIFFE